MHFALSILRLSSGINILKYELVKSDLGNRPLQVAPEYLGSSEGRLNQQ